MLEDSSFAIHPGMENQAGSSRLYSAGAAHSFKKNENGISILADKGELLVTFAREDIVRFTINFFGETRNETTPAVLPNNESVPFSCGEDDKQIIIKTERLKINIGKNPLLVEVLDKEGRVIARDAGYGMGFSAAGDIACEKELQEEDHFYGFGEKTGFLDKRGEKLSMWNSDVFAPHNPETDPLYQSIPFFMGLRNGEAFGLYFDNTFRSFFDMGRNNTSYSFGAEGGQLDYYLMAGPDPKSVLEQYTFLTGRMPIPPKWAIGYHQSRYSYESEQEVLELARLFSDKNIPLDAIYLDIHYMSGYRVFTFDKKAFPDPSGMISALKDKGIRVVPIVDPGIKKDPEYGVYREGVLNDHFCKYLEGETYYGEVWPGISAFPDFTDSKARDWWGGIHEFYTEKGIEGIWNDMNEPAVFNITKTMDLTVMHKNDGDPKTHRELHNLYGLRMAEATYNGMKKQLKGKRTFLLTRAGFSGIQRYAAVWTGDNRSFWEHLQMSLPMVMNLGLSGVAFAGPDVGGFAHDSNGELLARWTQAGAFTPYFRNHSAIGTARQEPWAFGDKYEEIIKKYIRLRYEWLPQLYTLFAETSFSGLPVMRPLFMEYPEDPFTWKLSDQFMVGDNVIVAPVMQPGAVVRAVYLPEGEWVDYWTGETFDGGKHHLVHAGLEVLPIFIKKGTMIALTEAKQSTDMPDKKIMLHLYYKEGAECTFKLYEDDGGTFAYEDGDYLKREYAVSQESRQITITVKDEGNYQPVWEEVQLVVHGAPQELALEIGGLTIPLAKKTDKLLVYSL